MKGQAHYREKVIKARDNLVSLWIEAHTPEEDTSNHSTTASQSVTSIKPSVNLPRIDLPKFSGDVLKFTSFWQQFTACVDDCDYPTIAKFNYLTSCLKGDASTVIEGLPITTENYETAKQMLKKRFGRKELIVFAHVQELLALSVPEQLSKFRDNLNVHVRSLATQGIAADNFGVILTPIVVSKLPEDVRLEWSRGSEGKEADLDYLLEFLDEEINRRERCKSFGSLRPQPQSQSREKTKHNRQSTAVSLHTSDNRSPTRSKSVKKCVFCNASDHSSTKCAKYLDVDVTVRYEMLKDAHVCFRCLSVKHLATKCNHKCSNCNGFHHVTICRRLESGSINENVHKPGSKDSNSSVQSSQATGSESNGPTLLTTNYKTVSLMPLASVEVGGQKAILLFDSGSDRSYISQDFVKRVKPRFVEHTDVSYATFGGKKQGSKSKVYEITMKGVYSSDQVTVQMPEVPVICLPLGKPKVDSTYLQEFEHLDLAFDYVSGVDNGTRVSIDILIGQDLFWLLMLGDIFRSQSSSLVAQKSVFGWILSGCTQGVTTGGITLLNIGSIPDHIVKSFWDLESLGIEDNDLVDPVLDKFRQGIQFNSESGRYKVPLTWKEKHPVLLSNERAVLSQYGKLEEKLDRDPALKEGYNQALSEMEDKGYIIDADKESTGSKIHYLPHHPHVRESSSTYKIRPVFNASCKASNGISLNDCLESGPNLNPNIVDVLCRFRRWKYAVTADVSKAFLQIELDDSDQDVHRFFWRKDREDSVRVMKFVRVTFGIKCSPFLLSATIKHHLSLCPPSFVVSELSENLYVDDLLSGTDSKTEVQELFTEAKRVLSKAGMELTKWKSNDDFIIGETVSDIGSQYVKILGVTWNPRQDAFTFGCMGMVDDDVRITKRSVLSLLARVFDPMGFVLPFTVNARHLFQDIWRLGLDWDDEVPTEMQKTFKTWLAGLSVLKGVSIPRRYFETSWSECKDEVELHAFGDASLMGYGACVYLVRRVASKIVECSLVRACARVAPLQRKTLPRLELLGSLVTAQLLKSVIKSLRMNDDVTYYCWTDSMVALGWIKGTPSKWKPWVANRVATIQSLTDPLQWGHVAGRDNPADIDERDFCKGIGRVSFLVERSSIPFAE